MYKINKIKYNLGDYLYSFFIVLMLLGYPIFSILATIVNNDSLTVYYRGVCLLLGALSLIIPSSSIKGKNTYNNTQLFIVALHIIYISWVLYYFASGYSNENLDLSFYVNNSILFSLIPVLFLTKNINEEFYPLLKSHLKLVIIFFILLTYYGYTSGLSDEYRLSFDKINPISLSLYAAIAIILCFWIFKTKFITWLVVLPLVAIMILSGSRGPLVALVAVACTFTFLRMSFIKKVYLVFLATLLIGLLFSFYQTAIEYLPILSRFNFATTEGGLSVNIREEQYKSAFSIFSDNPFLGGSLVEHFTYYYPHNIILEMLITGGVLLFLIYMVCFAKFATELVNGIRRKIPSEFIIIFFMLLISYMFTSSLAGIGLLYYTMTVITKMNVVK
ncbi:O-antigen ligase family protein [Leclercia sp. UBA1284]|uniref:O-antigen ligase family protein n=1 Tax=Leclercia sp. UBA1284 TaxID=1946737 RepID=UPI00257F00D2|nr:O-antigen ligase family protein [Leclercia sp. UBA1284]